MATKEELLSKILELPDSERAEVAFELLRSLHDPPDPHATEAWSREVERRAEEVFAGRAQLKDARSVLDELTRKYSRNT